MLFKKKTAAEQVEDYTEKQKQKNLKLETLKAKRLKLEEDKVFRDEVKKEESAIKELKSDGGDRVKAFGTKFREGAKKASTFLGKEGKAAGRTLSEVAGVAGTGKVRARWPSPLQAGLSQKNQAQSYFGGGESMFSMGKEPKEQGGYFTGGLFGQTAPVNKTQTKTKTKAKRRRKKK